MSYRLLAGTVMPVSACKPKTKTFVWVKRLKTSMSLKIQTRKIHEGRLLHWQSSTGKTMDTLSAYSGRHLLVWSKG